MVLPSAALDMGMDMEAMELGMEDMEGAMEDMGEAMATHDTEEVLAPGLTMSQRVLEIWNTTLELPAAPSTTASSLSSAP